MSVPVILTPKAKKDVMHAARWYGLRRHGLDHEFMEELDDHLTTMAAFPKGAKLISRTLRLLPMARFPYVITFRFTGKTIIIVRVVHGHRHPSVRIG